MSQGSAGHRPFAVLWILLFLFCVRVLGQLVTYLGWAPFLPPMHEWHSGLLPYGLLLAAQFAIIAAFAKVCVDVTTGKGDWSAPRPHLGRRLWIFGWLYLAAMVVRYVVRMAVYPDQRWTGGAIPIAFHWVLATFLLVWASWQRGVARGELPAITRPPDAGGRSL